MEWEGQGVGPLSEIEWRIAGWMCGVLLLGVGVKVVPGTRWHGKWT